MVSVGTRDGQREPARASTRPVAVYGSFSYGPYFEDVLSGITAAAEAAGTPVISIQTSASVLPSGHHVAGQSAVNRVAWDHFDAAITVLDSLSPDYIAELRAAGKYVVRVGQGRQGADVAVTIDNVGGIRAAVSHLAEHGHSRIGFLSPGWQHDATERYHAYRARMAELGLPVTPNFGADLPRDISFDQQGYQAAASFLAERQSGDGELRCTALLIAPDLVALGFMRALRENGVRVPDDLALMGIDDIDEAAISEPPLASVAISFKRLGARAFQVAREGGQGGPARLPHLVPERLVPRESCGCPSTGGRGSAAEQPSPVDDLATALIDEAREREVIADVNVEDVRRLARSVVDLLDGGSAAGRPPDPRQVIMLAEQINQLCPIDRAVQSALRMIRALGQTMAESAVRAGEAERTWAISASVMDLCDAIRSGQLLRRMSEHVDLKRLQMSHYTVGNTLLGHDRDELRSLAWLAHTPVKAGALGLWDPPGQTARLDLPGTYGGTSPSGPLAAEAFPPPHILDASLDRGGFVLITQIRFDDSDWGMLAVSGDRMLRSCVVQEIFHQWSILMSASLTQERADADLAAAYRTEAALLDEVRINEERYALAIEAARGAVWDWDIADGRVFYSSSFKALLGHRDGEIGHSVDEWLGRIHPDDAPVVQKHLHQILDGAAQQLDFEHRLRAATGEYRWISCTGRRVADESGRTVRLVGSITDVTARRLVQEQLVQDAQYDDLTGLAKGTLFKKKVNDALDAARCITVLFIDLNGFKAVNDRFGHATGDDLLVAVARRIQESLRAYDTAARLGGDEFAVLLDETVRHADVDPVVARIRSRITAPYEIRGRSVSVGAAIGVAYGDGRYGSADAMLHEADTAMYRDKRLRTEARPLPSITAR